MCSRAPGIRDTVRVLLALLVDCSCPHIPSESFRLAKFNKPEAVDPFWRILHHLTSLHLLLQSCDLTDLKDAPKDCCNSSEITHVGLCVRKRALDLGYTRSQFYVNEVGSRELLFFFAWLIQEVSLVSQLQTYHVRAALNAMSIPLSPSKTCLLDNIDTNSSSFDRQLEVLVSSPTNSLPLEHTLRKIQWLKGSLRGSGRSVENAHRAAARLSQSILHQRSSTAAQDKSLSSAHRLSLHDLFLLRYPDQLSACVKRLEWHVSCLEGLGRWQEHEPVFWQWMESVLDQFIHSQPPDEDNKEYGIDGNQESMEWIKERLVEEVYQCQLQLSSVIGECIEKVGASRESASVHQEANKTKSLCLPRVAVENSMLCPTVGLRESLAGVVESSHQLRGVEGELKRLEARLLEEEKTLHSLQSTLIAY